MKVIQEATLTKCKLYRSDPNKRSGYFVQIWHRLSILDKSEFLYRLYHFTAFV